MFERFERLNRWVTVVGLVLVTSVIALGGAAPASAATTGAPECTAGETIPTSGAGVTCSVDNEADLIDILEAVDSAYATDESLIPAQKPVVTTIEFAGQINQTSQLPIVNGPVTIYGNGNTLTGGDYQYPGLVLYNSVAEGACSADGVCPGEYPSSTTQDTIDDLTIIHGNAKGGNGGPGAGGGAGLGGGIFVGAGVSLTGGDMAFYDDSANGGAGGSNGDYPTDDEDAVGGGGGGMGGAGGQPYETGLFDAVNSFHGGGGGGLGTSATGGQGGTAGVMQPGLAWGLAAGCDSDPDGSSDVEAGGATGGGGGGAEQITGGGGGGGIGCTAGTDSSGGTDYSGGSGTSGGGIGGNGGFGGGGGSGYAGGNGGFGGAGGSADGDNTGSETESSAGTSGFGAGGSLNAAGGYESSGFGGGSPSQDVGTGAIAPGGGAAMGGAIFVQQDGSLTLSGSLTEQSSTVQGGSALDGGQDGSALGAGIFLQGDGTDVTFAPPAGDTQTVADDIADQSGNGGVGATEGYWGIQMTGAGTLVLEGLNSYSGGTVVSHGTLEVTGIVTGDAVVTSGAYLYNTGTITGDVSVLSGGQFCNLGTVDGTIAHQAPAAPTCYLPPTATITSPASGGTYNAGATVPTSFACTDSPASATHPAGTGIASCTDGNGGSGTSGTLNTSAVGTFTYTVTATSKDGLTSSSSITYTVVQPCVANVTFQLTQVTPSGSACIQKQSNGTYESPGPLAVNGVALPALPGSAQYVITPPNSAQPGGAFGVTASGALPNVTINLGGSSGFNINAGTISWNLPAIPTSGNKLGTVASLSIPAGQHFEGLEIGASVSMEFGIDSSGTYYATFPITLDLPSIFKSGPGVGAGGVTGTAAVRVDSNGVHFDGVHVEVTGAYIGSLQVKSACFAYLPSGASGVVNSCPAPALPGSPLPAVSCTASGGSSWSGSADVVLPFSANPEISLYGSVVNGSLSGLSVAASSLDIPLGEDVDLESLGLQLCAPGANQGFQIAGSVGIGAIKEDSGDNLVDVTGAFSYTDAWNAQPWSASVGGSVAVQGTNVGQGTMNFGPNNVVSFALSSSLNLSIVSINGQLSGFFETASPYQFSVQGNLGVCIEDIGCINGEGAVSSVGTSGCVTVASVTIYVPEKNSNWKWYAPWRIHWVAETTKWQAGFGYYWGGSVSIWGTSCDIGNYELATPAAANPGSFMVKRGHNPLSVRIAGAGGAPRVKITTPAGHVIEPPAGHRIGEKIPGVGLLLEQKAQDQTSLLLTSPQQGTWRVSPVKGSVPVTAIRAAATLPPPVVNGAAQSLASGKVGLGLAYSIAPGEKLTLYVSGPHHSEQLLGDADGKPCPDATGSGPSSRLCRELTFTPAYGPSGERTITGVVVNAEGLPVTTVKVGTVRVSFAHPGGIRLSVRRNHGVATVNWAALPHTASYAVSANISDGRKLSITTTKLSASIPNVDLGKAVAVTVWPVMTDGSVGKSAGAALRSKTGCEVATGALDGTTLGPLTLGLPKSEVTQAFPSYSVTSYGTDRFCFEHGDIRVGYASDGFLKTLPRSLARALKGRVVVTVTANDHYTLDGIRPGMRVGTARRKAQLGVPAKIAGTSWYVLPGTRAAGLVSVQGGVVSEVGIADKRLAADPATLKALLTTFKDDSI
jgi:Passenger-associated-transport-repeat